MIRAAGAHWRGTIMTSGLGGSASGLKKRSKILAAGSAVLLGACSQSADIGTASLSPGKSDKKNVAAATDPKSELDRAIGHWGKEFAEKPRDLKAALSYARNLRAAGQKEQALSVLQHAATYHGENRELASEYGRLALDIGQVALAQKLLEGADDPAKPDWRVISARGTALAKQGKYKEAIPYYERSLALSKDQPSTLNNLAMAYAATGEVGKAEGFLRQAAEAKGSDPRVNQNLALVLGLQGKYDEARVVAARDLPADSAASNVDYVRRMVKLEPKPAGPSVMVAKAAAPTPTLQLRGSAGDAPVASANAWAAQVAQSQPSARSARSD